MIEIKISNKPLRLKSFENKTTSLSGCINIFAGKVRGMTNNKAVNYLIYETYKLMAIFEIQKIAETSMKRFGTDSIFVYHRIGKVKVGEIAVIIAVVAGHRKPAIKATQYIIDNLKRKVPIWKKEVYEDGEEWVSANP